MLSPDFKKNFGRWCHSFKIIQMSSYFENLSIFVVRFHGSNCLGVDVSPNQAPNKEAKSLFLARARHRACNIWPVSPNLM